MTLPSREEVLEYVTGNHWRPPFFSDLCKELWSDNPGILIKHFGPIPDGHLEPILQMIDQLPSASNNGINDEYKKLIFGYCVAVCLRCGIRIKTDGSVELEPQQKQKTPERILVGPYGDTITQKAIVLLRKIIRVLFWIGAFRIGLAVANLVLLEVHRRVQTSKARDMYAVELDRTFDTLTNCIFYFTNESEGILFQDSVPFLHHLDILPDPKHTYCRHNVVILSDIYTGCIFQNQKKPEFLARSCAK